MNIIAYSYESDVHCVACAKAAFVSPAALMWLGVLFETDERVTDLTCGTCRELIAPSTLEETP